MDVKTLCLGVLSLGDASGYEIKKVFEDAFSHFYVAGYGSIYPALADLIRQGLVTCTDVEQAKRPAKKVYHLTAAGETIFRKALAETHPAHKVRSDFLVQMVFAGMLSPARLGAILEQRLVDIEAELGHIADCQSQGEGLDGGARFAAGYASAVLNAGRAYILEHGAALLEQVQIKDISS